MSFRKDIEGLRGLSVLLVLFFHLDLEFFSGGFIGVDVFFVISGYLITQIICNDLEKKKFSYKNFYFRRTRRLLPAFVIVLFIVFCSSFFIFEDFHFVEFAESMFFSLFSVSNIYFWKNIGYFAQDSIFKPLLHFWSLAVEVQFYLFWPIFVVLIYNFNKRLFLFLTILLILISFFLNKIFLDNGTAFYQSPTRAFQFLLGSLLSLKSTFTLNKKIKINLLFSFGIFLILFSSVIFNSSTHYPYINALPPTIGTVLIIGTASNVSRNLKLLLENKILLFFGKISYPLYLIHWPIIVFINYSFSISNLYIITIVISFSTLIAFVINEITSRDGNLFKISLFKYFSYGKSFLVFLLLIFLSVLSWNEILKKKYLEIDEEGQMANLIAKEGNDSDYAFIRMFKNHQFFVINNNQTPKTLVIGDSHAAHFIPSFKVNKHMQDTHIFFRGGCIPLLNGYLSVNTLKCREYSDIIFSYLKENRDDIINVIFAGRWANYLTSELFHEFETFVNVEGNDVSKTKQILFSKDKNFLNEDISTSRKNFLASFEETIKFLSDKDIKVIIFGQVPPFGFPKSYIGTDKVENVNDKKKKRISDFNSWAAEFCKKDSYCRFLDLSKYFLINGDYSSDLNTFFAFHDYSHLNVKGSIILGKLIENDLKKILEE